MKKMLKRVLVIFFLLAILVLPYFVFAKTTPLQGLENVQETSGYAPATETSLASLAGSIIATAFSLLGIIFVILILYGGYLWMTDQGNEEQVEKAKKVIRNSVIGLIILLSAWGMYALFTSLFAATLN